MNLDFAGVIIITKGGLRQTFWHGPKLQATRVGPSGVANLNNC